MEQGHEHQRNCQPDGDPSGKVLPVSCGNRRLRSKGWFSASPGGSFDVELRRYKYGDLQYPSFVTSGNYAGEVLFHSNNGLVAGEQSYQKGSVLFVNLPLGYLKGSTDGLLLHVFLKYFAEPRTVLTLFDVCPGRSRGPGPELAR